MVWLKKSWFSVVGVVLLAIIAFNVWQIADIRSSTPSAGNEAATASTSSNRADGQNQKAVPEDLTPSPAPHEIAIRLAVTNGEAEFDGDSLTGSVKTIDSVEEAVFEGKTLKVTLTGPVNLSELLGRLSLQQVGRRRGRVPASRSLAAARLRDDVTGVCLCSSGGTLQFGGRRSQRDRFT